MDEKHGTDGKTDAPAASAPAKKPWSKPRIWVSDGVILHRVESGITEWSQNFENADYRPTS